MALSFSQHRDTGVVTVMARGEVDLSTADDLQREVEAAVRGDSTAVTVDLGEVTFLDSAGINVLLRGRRLADEHGKPYHVTNAQGIVRQLLRMTGVWDHLCAPEGG
ncbi:STAS domain-containing protein [Micromonospora globbae]|uniref:Anti-sigma factor antagonist n=1 Tax=Micromonospora globbae TaxID=1894969 RepID=A0A420ETF3_9ACTN|nr:STAS domain-containing protein [Micromonospora globbae]RKF23962.1 anti-sigma factor antagonist [Micromonospora globbae]WTF88158.1 STAS domain-containing protein [Micromonospora globbae]